MIMIIFGDLLQHTIELMPFFQIKMKRADAFMPARPSGGIEPLSLSAATDLKSAPKATQAQTGPTGDYRRRSLETKKVY